MRLEEMKGNDIVRAVLHQLAHKIANTNRRPSRTDVTISITYKPRGNIAGLLLHDELNDVTVWLILDGQNPDQFLIWTALHGEAKPHLDEGTSLAFTFIEGTRVYKYLLRDYDEAAIDLYELFHSEARALRGYELIHGKDQYYSV